MSHKSARDRYWEQAEIWVEELNHVDRARLPKTISMIPADVQEILEVGCGNGRLTNKITGRYRVIGVDLSETALRFVSGRRVVGSADALPLKPGSVDLVVCADLLEHLPDQALTRSVSEIKRVSRKYLLVGVPFREPVQYGYAKCDACGHVFNGFLHLRRFTRATLDRLFRDCAALDAAYVGGARKYRNRLLLLIQQRLGNTYWGVGGGEVCPACGHSPCVRPARNPVERAISRLCHLLNELLDRLIPDRLKPQHEIIRLYRTPPDHGSERLKGVASRQSPLGHEVTSPASC